MWLYFLSFLAGIIPVTILSLVFLQEETRSHKRTRTTLDTESQRLNDCRNELAQVQTLRQNELRAHLEVYTKVSDDRDYLKSELTFFNKLLEKTWAELPGSPTIGYTLPEAVAEVMTQKNELSAENARLKLAKKGKKVRR